jgi:hypothetical protein
MKPRLPYLPTLAQFLDAAKREGCDVRTINGRIVIENPANGIPVPVPKHLNYTDQLTQHTTEYLARNARIPGFNFDYSGPATSEDYDGPSEDEET